VGYVLYVEVQRLNAAHGVEREGAESLRDTVRRLDEEVRHLNSERRSRSRDMITSEGLNAEFEEALKVGGDVHFAAMGFTGETFAVPLKQILEKQIQENGSGQENSPRHLRRTVYIRVLVPDFTKPIEVPGLIGTDGKVTDAPGFRRNLVQQIRSHEARLKGMISRMEDHSQGVLSVEFRVMHMSPSLKLYLINDNQAYEGIYDKIERRRNEYDSEDPAGGTGAAANGRLLDLLGYDSLLTRWRWEDGERAREVIIRRRMLFDAYWDAAHEFSAVSGRSEPSGQ
jgi:hypothetical protein